MSMRSLLSRVLPFLVASKPLDKRTQLVKLLGDARYEFRKLSTLAEAIGESHAVTEAYLAGLNAVRAINRDTREVLYKL